MNKKAIALAKDVLANLKDLNIKSEKTYCYADAVSGLPDDQAKKHFKALKENCQVCALGACFLSYIHKWNNVTIGELTQNGDIHVDRHLIVEKLRGILSSYQLSLIEGAFELNYTGSYDAREFGMKYKTDKSRLRAILNNIIKNNGEFLP